MTDTYTARLELASGQWVAELEEIPQVHTFGRTLGKAKEYLFDALALWLDVPVDDVRGLVSFAEPALPPEVQAAVASARTARCEADRATRVALRQTNEAIAALVVDAHLSMRDTAEILGISHQRVHQLMQGNGCRTPSVSRGRGAGRRSARGTG